jgi:D-arabinose 1-dehydrogenase-like Zn-dependent alcohol dehydrogenase
MLRVVGSNTGSVADLREAVRAINTARIRPVVDHVHEFDDAAGAYAMLSRAGHFGKIAIMLGDGL